MPEELLDGADVVSVLQKVGAVRVLRKRAMRGQALKSSAQLRVVFVEPIGSMTLFDITTGTGDFMANGVVSHDCYARPTHQYFSSGAEAVPSSRQRRRGSGTLRSIDEASGVGLHHIRPQPLPAGADHPNRAA
ncbi:MAG: hypothetical protein HY704_05855 [Gemmatimonadetes bacterium]|nr:hypothetical protein [Gemmatimonadota bacterium]